MKNIASYRLMKINYESGYGYGIIDLKFTMSDGETVTGGKYACASEEINPADIREIEVAFTKQENRIYYIKFTYRNGTTKKIGL
jgi:hypothetical protein